MSAAAQKRAAEEKLAASLTAIEEPARRYGTRWKQAHARGRAVLCGAMPLFPWKHCPLKPLIANPPRQW